MKLVDMLKNPSYAFTSTHPTDEDRWENAHDFAHIPPGVTMEDYQSWLEDGLRNGRLTESRRANPIWCEDSRLHHQYGDTVLRLSKFFALKIRHDSRIPRDAAGLVPLRHLLSDGSRAGYKGGTVRYSAPDVVNMIVYNPTQRYGLVFLENYPFTLEEAGRERTYVLTDFFVYATGGASAPNIVPDQAYGPATDAAYWQGRRNLLLHGTDLRNLQSILQLGLRTHINSTRNMIHLA